MSWGNRIVSVLCTLCLAVTFVAAGFVAVAVPDTATTMLADKYAGTTNESTPFSHDELCDMALAGKRYTFDTNDKGALLLPFGPKAPGHIAGYVRYRTVFTSPSPSVHFAGDAPYRSEGADCFYRKRTRWIIPNYVFSIE